MSYSFKLTIFLILVLMAISIANANKSCLEDIVSDQSSLDEIYESQLGMTNSRIYYQFELEGAPLSAKAKALAPEAGNRTLFTYYQLVGGTDKTIAGQVVLEMGKGERFLYKTKLLVARDPWKAFNVKQKLIYLNKLEADRVAKGEKVWGGHSKKNFLLLERGRLAPRYVSKNPSFERFAYASNKRRESPAGVFSLPEIMTGRNSPTKTINQLVERSQQVTTDTGHSSAHYHTFIELTPAEIKTRASAIVELVEEFNDYLITLSLAEGRANLGNIFIHPWSSAKSVSATKMLLSGEAGPRLFKDVTISTKLSPLAIRYWGKKDGKVIISLELRKTRNPMKAEGGGIPQTTTLAKEEVGFKRVRDYSQTKRHLAMVRAQASRVLKGDNPSKIVKKSKHISYEDANRVLQNFAREHGVGSGSYFDIKEMATLINRQLPGTVMKGGEVNPNFLFPFTKMALGGKQDERFLRKFLEISMTMKKAESRGDLKSYLQTYFAEIGDEYSSWASRRLTIARRRVESRIRDNNQR